MVANAGDERPPYCEYRREMYVAVDDSIVNLGTRVFRGLITSHFRTGLSR